METLELKPELRDRERVFVDDLRRMADFLESRPDLIPFSGFEASHFASDKAQAASLIRKMGKATKEVSEIYMTAKREFGPHTISVYVSREKVCTRVQVGTKTVTVKEAVGYTEVEKEVPVYEWECNPVLGTDPEALPEGIEASAVEL